MLWNLKPFSICCIVIMPEFEVSIARKASRMVLKSNSRSEVMLFTRNFSVSFWSVFGARKSFNLLTIDSLIGAGVTIESPSYIQGWLRLCAVVIRVFGFLSSIFEMRSFASSEMSDQSTGLNFRSC